MDEDNFLILLISYIHVFQVVFVLPSISKLFLTQASEEFLKLLSHISYIHPQIKMKDLHVEMESDEWFDIVLLLYTCMYMYL
jgi:hypothetical protein